MSWIKIVVVIYNDWLFKSQSANGHLSQKLTFRSRLPQSHLLQMTTVLFMIIPCWNHLQTEIVFILEAVWNRSKVPPYIINTAVKRLRMRKRCNS